MQLSALIVMLVLFFTRPTIVGGKFMDMYGKLFQIELLDDCSVYVYDRVLFFKATKTDWCKLKKSSFYMDLGRPELNSDNGTRFFVVMAIYRDDDNLVKTSVLDTDGINEYPLNYVWFSQDYLETRTKKSYSNLTTTMHVPHTATEYGRYFVLGYVIQEKYIHIYYEACKYGKTTSKNFTTGVSFNGKQDFAYVEPSNDCDPNVITNHAVSLGGGRYTNVKVYVDPNHPEERQCSVGNETFVLRPIKQSIQTAVLAYSMITDWSKTLYTLFSTLINEHKSKFIGATKSTERLLFNGKNYKRPKIEKDYTEQPFFFYNATENMYSPLFLYYKFTGSDRRFSVRFVYDGNFYDIFAPMEYMKQCNFPTADSGITVAAAPRVVKQDEQSISIEVYFLINNVNFQFCVFDVQYRYKDARYDVSLNLTSEINAYVHVEKRSTTAANCDYAGRTVRWLLAYSSKNDDAELVSLDNSVSSPIFRCPHCGPDSKMYCDVHPEAKKYYSAVFIQTVNNGKTDVTYVRLVNPRGYQLKAEYHTSTLSDEFYFVQNIDMSMFPKIDQTMLICALELELQEIKTLKI